MKLQLTARDIMTSPVVTVQSQASVVDVAKTLTEKRISGVAVVDAQGLAVGVITQTDLLHRVAHPHLPPYVNILGSVFFLQAPHKVDELVHKMSGVLAQDVMSKPVVSAAPDTPVSALADTMLERKVGRVLILEQGRPVGVVTRADIVSKVVASGQD